ncbi:TIGR00730 family Rossman fold protein [Phytohabitans sp. ZYX-F-186]|uniref:Cytokinin riboside 5'-monophosphate phosphoribohydrolase n=1 Tax=Phytohabitans maris TaxID=3071409 RepID=A0ABU0ZTZ9_9ACTN|nr:TIGR00730 family Rossman fold protein [Phytohabitans sp. ZYX-F-186]MDQ7910514.1 TIGR00730 family Rossman fold protein [Phytohabitans sp. ZYX-F-186]
MAAICVFCASSRRLEQRWLDLADATGREIARRGHTLVSGGGRVGMMGAVAEGARAGGAHTLGVIPQTLVDREIADLAADELVVTDDMFDRKAMMIEKSDAFLTLPGGLGTLDELFEVWTTAMLGLHRKPVAIVDTPLGGPATAGSGPGEKGGFYTGLVAWLRGLAETAFAREDALDLLIVADSVPAALSAIEARLG